jgi:hypothetical protein
MKIHPSILEGFFIATKPEPALFNTVKHNRAPHYNIHTTIAIDIRHPFGIPANKLKTMLTIILLLTGLGCFWLFYKITEWFEKI